METLKPLTALWNVAACVTTDRYGRSIKPHSYAKYLVKREIRSRLRGGSKGKGNKWRKRAEAQEKAFRQSGGFYLSDLVTF